MAFLVLFHLFLEFPRLLSGKESLCQYRRHRRCGSMLGSGRSPRRRNGTHFSGSEGKASAYNAGDTGSIPGSGRSPGEGNGSPLQYSCLEDPKDKGAWWATVHGVAKSWTRLSDWHSHFQTVFWFSFFFVFGLIFRSVWTPDNFPWRTCPQSHCEAGKVYQKTHPFVYLIFHFYIF